MSKRETDSAAWTTRGLLAWTARYFERQGLDSARLAAEMLLAHVLEVPRINLYMDLDRPTTQLERAAFRDLVERAAAHEPVDYLVGQSPFFSVMFKVTPDVLIPRPSTETLVEHVLQHARRTPGFRAPLIADVGTGSGAISVSVARQIDDAHVIATDISASALAVACENAATHDVSDRVDFVEGDLLTPLEGKRVRYLLSNPPYISDAEWRDVAPNVKDYEPERALRGGADGLELLRPIIEQAPGVMDSPGQLVVEIAASQKQAVLDIAAGVGGYDNAHVLVDHERLPRVLVCDVK